MKALVQTGNGGPEVLQVQERPDPPVGPGEVRIAVKAAGINFADTMARVGLYPDAPKPPCVIGYEVAGEVESRSARASSDHAVGDRVMAGTRFGGQAELVTVPADQVLPLPERLSFEQGAAFPVNYGTAYAALIIMGGLREGDRVLIHAAAGGVGIAATQIARNVGAEIFGTASPSKHDAIRAQGVAHAIDYRSQDFEAEAMRITGGEGVDLIIDALGPTSFRKDYRLLRSGGRLVMYGLSEVTKEGGRDLPATLQEPGEDAAGDDALVEEPGDDEREQGGLRPQHAQVVGPRGQPRPGDRAADGRTSRRGAWSRSSPRPSPSSGPATRTDSSPSAATSARLCCSLIRRPTRLGGGSFRMKKAILITLAILAAQMPRRPPMPRTDLHRASRRRAGVERDPHLAHPRRPQLRDRLDRTARSRRRRSAKTRPANPNELICQAPLVGGFEVNADDGDDTVTVSSAGRTCR